ncbi:MAG: hypothetical protein K9I85_16075 [Saprospiraceae bacterium]|nr:hypothetical protein [Saprospiraceae bacterium]
MYYRLWSTETSTIVNGGFTTGDDGGFVVTPVNATRVSNFTPPGTNQPDEYYCFDFTGQTLVVPANGILWFRFDGLNGSCSQARRDIGALGTYTTTYQQQNFTRSGGTSFIIFGNDGCSVDNEPPVVSCPPDQSNIPCSDWPGSLAAWTANHPAPVNGVDFENQGGTVTDNCSADVDISVSVVDSDNGGSVCSGPVLVVSRTYTLTDESGNQSVCTQTFTFNQDQGPPVFAEAPGELDITIAVTTQDYCHNQPAYYIIN